MHIYVQYQDQIVNSLTYFIGAFESLLIQIVTFSPAGQNIIRYDPGPLHTCHKLWTKLWTNANRIHTQNNKKKTTKKNNNITPTNIPYTQIGSLNNL